jgi:excisionase family DNA binding protein
MGILSLPEAEAVGDELGGVEPVREERAERSTSVDQLAAATRRLAETIARTERLAQERAELLRTADASAGYRNMLPGAGLVSLSEAAKRTGRHPEVLRRWCMDGRLPAVRVGRTWAISHESLSTLMSHRARARPRLAGDPSRR